MVGWYPKSFFAASMLYQCAVDSCSATKRVIGALVDAKQSEHKLKNGANAISRFKRNGLFYGRPPA